MSANGTSRLVAAFLTVWFLGVGLVQYQHTELPDDVVEYVNNPWRIVMGELPYRDFWLIHPPGEVLWPALLYSLGFDVNALLLMNVATSALAGLAAYWVARNVTASIVAGLVASVLVFFAGEPAHYAGYAYSHVYLLCLIVAAGFLASYFQGRTRWKLFIAGVTVGLSFTFRFYLSGAAAAAMVVTLICEARSHRSRAGEIGGALAIFLAGTLVAPAALCVSLAEVWPALIREVVVESVGHATSQTPLYGYFIVRLWSDFAHCVDFVGRQPGKRTLFAAFESASVLIEVTTIHVVPFLTAAVWIFHRRRNGPTRAPADWSALFFLLWGGLTFVRAIGRGGAIHTLAQSVTPMYFVLVILARPLAGRSLLSPKPGALAAAAAIAIVVGALAQQAALVTLQAGIAFRHRAPVALAPYGSLFFSDAQRAENIREVLVAVVENSRENDYLFVTPWDAPPFYALTRRRNPTYYDSPIDLIYRPSAEKERAVCAALLAKDTRLVVHRPGWSYPNDPGQRKFEQLFPLLDHALSEHFEPILRAGPYVVYRRNARS